VEACTSIYRRRPIFYDPKIWDGVVRACLITINSVRYPEGRPASLGALILRLGLGEGEAMVSSLWVCASLPTDARSLADD
jgi:hypothetical protein